MNTIPDVAIRPLEPADAEAYAAALRANRAFLAPFEPLRDPAFFTDDGQRLLLAKAAADREAGTAYAFAIVDGADGGIVGMVQLSHISRGAWENAALGYWVAESYNGHGVATAAVGHTLAFAFGPLQLHRVQAGVMPRNVRSIRVLEKNGFRREGLAERYLRIAGRWEDHIMFAITAEAWVGRRRGGSRPSA